MVSLCPMEFGIEWIDIRLNTLLLLYSKFSICDMQMRGLIHYISKNIIVAL